MMAELIYSLMSNQDYAPQFGPDIYLYRVQGISEFRDAVTDAIKNGVQIISYSDIREFGSNWDGKGFWNKEVDRAIASGIIWVNAAGNFARRTFNSPISFNANRVVLPDEGSTLTLKCDSQCKVRIVLSWNDFKDDMNKGTSKDLDLFLEDGNGNKIKSTLEQVLELPEGKLSEKGKTLYPQEHIETVLQAGLYSLSVSSKNPSAFGPGDKLRVTVDGPGITLNHFDVAESLLNPADDSQVVTVGALDSDQTAVSLALHKPEFLTASSLFYNGKEFKGSSISTAIVAAGFGMLKFLHPEFDREALLKACGDADTSSMNNVFRIRLTK
jgi:hypothetical protein